MKYEENYFQGEYRNGFYVSGMMKRNWAAQLEVLEEVKKVCKKHDIKYFADFGTLLGAVRHKGFIPWDDDVDISMLREDYQKFLAVASKELPKEYLVRSIHTEEEYDDLMIRINNSSQISYGAEYLRQYHGCPFVVGIDIFPIDYVPKDPAEIEFQKTMIGSVLSLINHLKKDTVTQRDLEETLENLQQICGINFDNLSRKELARQLLLLAEGLFAMYTGEETEEVTSMPGFAQENYQPWSKHCYDELIEVPFENTTIMIPKRFDEILRTEYGDYMRMVRGVASHNYPSYRNQNKILEEYLIENQIEAPGIVAEELENSKRYMKTLVPIEMDDFRKIKGKDYYYVDKTNFIKDFPMEEKRLWYIIAPERFGKSVLFSGWEYYSCRKFESIGENIETDSLYEDLSIKNDKQRYKKNISICFDFKGYNAASYQEVYGRLKNNLAYWFKCYSFVGLSEKLTEQERAMFEMIEKGNGDDGIIADAFRIFSKCLMKAYGQKVVVRLDNIDALLSNAYQKEYYDQMYPFMKKLLQNTLLDNDALQTAILTGEYEIAAEDWLQGIAKDEIGHISLYDTGLGQYIGYTEDEVREMFSYYQMQDQIERAREWFGGYGPDQNRYNPWSINNYVFSVCNGAKEPYTYWIESSNDSLRSDLMKKFRNEMEEDICRLLNKETIEKKVHREIHYDRLFHSIEEAWNYLFLTGSLAAKEVYARHGEEYAELRIPNEECRQFWQDWQENKK